MTKYFGYKYLVNWPMIIEIYENPLGYFYCLLHTVRVKRGNFDKSSIILVTWPFGKLPPPPLVAFRGLLADSPPPNWLRSFWMAPKLSNSLKPF